MTAVKDTLRALNVLQGPFVPFDVEDVPEEPVELFLHWLDIAIASDVPEPHAMTLSTVDADGFPDARVLILKNVDEAGFHFAISSASRKGRHLAAMPEVALTFYWQKLARQVRVRGTAVDLGDEARAADFAARPSASRAAAMLGRQSDVLWTSKSSIRLSRGRCGVWRRSLTPSRNIGAYMPCGPTRSSSGRVRRTVVTSVCGIAEKAPASSGNGSGPEPRELDEPTCRRRPQRLLSTWHESGGYGEPLGAPLETLEPGIPPLVNLF